ncbi:MAG: DegT/DnrJ/EryC1/StrS family aminotransferase [Anaerolineaceae bacterium]|nr:DegT/DnrJ/EryC1/StrS family aminotransferase [Anaerolineaceae bacterium]
MDWKITLADINFNQDEYQAVLDVLKSGWLSMGAVTQQFEEEFKPFSGTEYAFAVTNCTAALHLACEAVGITEGDEVILPSLTFVATANAVRYAGGTPVFADVVSEENLTISPASIEARITPKTKAIIVMHYAGYPCDMEAINRIAKQHDLKVIEDAAHAVGASFQGKPLGSWSDVACFSFFPNKNMTTAEGGMITTNDPEIADKIRLLRSHGMTTLTWERHQGHAWSYDVVDLGYNYRIDEIRSAIGREQLKKLPRANQIRQALTHAYWEQLAAKTPEIICPFINHPQQSAHHIFPILLPEHVDRVGFIQAMKQNGIQTSIHYPPIHHFSYYAQSNQPAAGLEITEKITQHELTIPLHPGLTTADIEYVADTMKQILAEK